MLQVHSLGGGDHVSRINFMHNPLIKGGLHSTCAIHPFVPSGVVAKTQNMQQQIVVM